MIDSLSGIAEYQCKTNLNLYDSQSCDRLCTQAAMGRHLWLETQGDHNWHLEVGDETGHLENRHDSGHFVNCPKSSSLPVRLCEDDYEGWISTTDLKNIKPAAAPYCSAVLTEEEVQAKVAQAVAFVYQAMDVPNQYLWGGTVGPDYDCSGLVQSAFVSADIWLPRDAYQQEAFVRLVTLDFRNVMLSCLKLGDLVFFGTAQRASHVGLYVGEGQYIHSSGKDQGRGRVGI
ncbi:MAG: NlpC/P60 family protein, partial [Microcoleaceae cyanobacterium]